MLTSSDLLDFQGSLVLAKSSLVEDAETESMVTVFLQQFQIVRDLAAVLTSLNEKGHFNFTASQTTSLPFTQSLSHFHNTRKDTVPLRSRGAVSCMAYFRLFFVDVNLIAQSVGAQ